MGDRAVVSSASPTESCPILKPVNSTVSNQRVALRYFDFSVNQHAVNLNLTSGIVMLLNIFKLPEHSKIDVLSDLNMSITTC